MKFLIFLILLFFFSQCQAKRLIKRVARHEKVHKNHSKENEQNEQQDVDFSDFDELPLAEHLDINVDILSIINEQQIEYENQQENINHIDATNQNIVQDAQINEQININNSEEIIDLKENIETIQTESISNTTNDQETIKFEQLLENLINDSDISIQQVNEENQQRNEIDNQDILWENNTNFQNQTVVNNDLININNQQNSENTNIQETMQNNDQINEELSSTTFNFEQIINTDSNKGEEIQYNNVSNIIIENQYFEDKQLNEDSQQIIYQEQVFNDHNITEQISLEEISIIQEEQISQQNITLESQIIELNQTDINPQESHINGEQQPSEEQNLEQFKEEHLILIQESQTEVNNQQNENQNIENKEQNNDELIIKDEQISEIQLEQNFQQKQIIEAEHEHEHEPIFIQEYQITEEKSDPINNINENFNNNMITDSIQQEQQIVNSNYNESINLSQEDTISIGQEQLEQNQQEAQVNTNNVSETNLILNNTNTQELIDPHFNEYQPFSDQHKDCDHDHEHNYQENLLHQHQDQDEQNNYSRIEIPNQYEIINQDQQKINEEQTQYIGQDNNNFEQANILNETNDNLSDFQPSSCSYDNRNQCSDSTQEPLYNSVEIDLINTPNEQLLAFIIQILQQQPIFIGIFFNIFLLILLIFKKILFFNNKIAFTIKEESSGQCLPNNSNITDLKQQEVAIAQLNEQYEQLNKNVLSIKSDQQNINSIIIQLTTIVTKVIEKQNNKLTSKSLNDSNEDDQTLRQTRSALLPKQQQRPVTPVIRKQQQF